MQDQGNKPRAVNWRAIDRRGRARTGRSEVRGDELAAMVHRWFRAGWRSVVVLDGRTEVAGITRNEGRRAWWAES